MDVSKSIIDALEKAVKERFGDSLLNVHIESVEVDEFAKVIRFDLRVETVDDPSAVAKRLFGLPALIRNNLRREDRRLFPVITPVVGPAEKVVSA